MRECLGAASENIKLRGEREIAGAAKGVRLTGGRAEEGGVDDYYDGNDSARE